MTLKPHAHGAQAAKGHVTVVGSGANSHHREGLPQRRPGCLIGRNRSDQDIGMAGRIFGRGVNRNVDTMVERLEEQRCRPGVVHGDQRAVRVGDFGDGRYVLHFESVGAGRFGMDQFGIGAHELFDVGADGGIIISGLDAKSRQHAMQKVACRRIDRINHQQMVTSA
jgi:hypothetical protein